MQHTATQCNKLQRTATHCNTLQHIATRRMNTRQGGRISLHHFQQIMQAPDTCLRTLQHTATHCNTPQHTATHRMNTQQSEESRCITLNKLSKHRIHVSEHCNTLQHTATHCNTPYEYSAERRISLHHFRQIMQAPVTWDEPELYPCHKRIIHEKVLTTTHWNILQRAATHCKIGHVGRIRTLSLSQTNYS